MNIFYTALWITYLSGSYISLGAAFTSIVIDHRSGANQMKWWHFPIAILLSLLSWIVVGVFIAQEFKHPPSMPTEPNHE